MFDQDSERQILHEEVRYHRSMKFPGLVLSTARFSSFRFEPHYHLDCHIALVTAGVQRQHIHGASMLLSRGTIQLMPPGEVHDGIAGADGSYALQTFRISPELLNGAAKEITGKQVFPAQAAAVLHDADIADQLIRMHTALQHPSVDELRMEDGIITLFEALFINLLKPVPQNVSGTMTSQQLRLVRDFMNAHIGEKIILHDLAALIDVDRFRFLKIFKRTTGMTPHAWLLRLRLEKALQLIKAKGDLPIIQIAHAVGFFDQSHFNRAFKCAYGVTPTNF